MHICRRTFQLVKLDVESKVEQPLLDALKYMLDMHPVMLGAIIKLFSHLFSYVIMVFVCHQRRRQLFVLRGIGEHITGSSV
jgi:hypothetical protein